MLKAIEEFVQFCTLLSKPENQIRIPSGQYIEREVTARSSVDMKAEMAQELAGLPRYTAWTKILDPSDGVLKNKIKTFNVADRFEFNKNYMNNVGIILKKTHESCCTRRDLIEEEINKRQAKWKKDLSSLSAEKTLGKKVEDRSGKPPPIRSPT